MRSILLLLLLLTQSRSFAGDEMGGGGGKLNFLQSTEISGEGGLTGTHGFSLSYGEGGQGGGPEQLSEHGGVGPTNKAFETGGSMGGGPRN